jgi:hypothetical protein
MWLLDEVAKETDKKGNKTKVEREKVERKKFVHVAIPGLFFSNTSCCGDPMMSNILIV